jgi:hypothetical protein
MKDLDGMVVLALGTETEPETEETPEIEISTVPTATPTTAPYPYAMVLGECREWFSVVCTANDLPDYMATIPEFHYKAFASRILTVLMKAGVFEDLDGRLKANKE